MVEYSRRWNSSRGSLNPQFAALHQLHSLKLCSIPPFCVLVNCAVAQSCLVLVLDDVDVTIDSLAGRKHKFNEIMCAYNACLF